MQDRQGKQGVQGSYNKTMDIRHDLKRFERAWVNGMLQSLNYDGREKAKWQAFAAK